MSSNLTPEQRFWNKVNKDGPTMPHMTTPCWTWTAKIERTGYGAMKLQGKTVKAHRFSYVLHSGKVPEGLLVLHRCDNRSCINPDHLWLGTTKDNAQDRERKNRSNHPFKKGDGHLFKLRPELGDRKRWKRNSRFPRGEEISKKLTTQDALNIIDLYNSKKMKTREIAKIYNISEAQVLRIATGKSWAHLQSK